MSAAPKIPSQIIGASYYNKLGITGKNVTIAILDSGLAPHPDIEQNRILIFKDFVNQKNHLYDDCQHGTHVTGIIASNKIGIAPETNIIPLKVLDNNGTGSLESFNESTKWILSNYKKYQIKIVNISIGTQKKELSDENNPINQWTRELWNAGLVVCCSAGNNGPHPNSITSPGNCKEVITVGSYDGKSFSSAGSLSPLITKPEIVAPGYHIQSTKPYNGYQIKNGTSMSVPFVSGAISLLIQLNPYLTNEEIKLHLMNTAKPSNILPYHMQGAGILDLHQLLKDYM
ncbi:MAG: S8 family peptidase [Lachnospiraceae bacterium]